MQELGENFASTHAGAVVTNRLDSVAVGDRPANGVEVEPVLPALVADGDQARRQLHELLGQDAGVGGRPVGQMDQNLTGELEQDQTLHKYTSPWGWTKPGLHLAKREHGTLCRAIWQV